MPLMVRRDAATPRPTVFKFSVWGMVLWMLLLLAAFGALQYLKVVLSDAPQEMKTVAYPYLVAAFAIIVVCAGCVLRQEWARQTMRILAPLLVLWLLVSGYQMLLGWGQFAKARESVLGQPMADVLLLMIDQSQRTYVFSLIFKGVMVPLLLWLAWRLGQPAIGAQFHQRRRG
ncbi:hypothetical protein [Dyella silvatica]|uniref:hypothetical protein n=1 Tax=Dyella silvatica TaxID=2992128 RepID=UPI002253360F|nr:hypothetical protein [Dyella silvatica]